MVQVVEGRLLLASDGVNIGSSDVLCPWSSIAFIMRSSKLECWLLFCESSISLIWLCFVLNADSLNCSLLILHKCIKLCNRKQNTRCNFASCRLPFNPNLQNLNQLLVFDKCSEWWNLRGLKNYTQRINTSRQQIDNWTLIIYRHPQKHLHPIVEPHSS